MVRGGVCWYGSIARREFRGEISGRQEVDAAVYKGLEGRGQLLQAGRIAATVTWAVAQMTAGGG